jgi:hypothetical protein
MMLSGPRELRTISAHDARWAFFLKQADLEPLNVLCKRNVYGSSMRLYSYTTVEHVAFAKHGGVPGVNRLKLLRLERPARIQECREKRRDKILRLLASMAPEGWNAESFADEAFFLGNTYVRSGRGSLRSIRQAAEKWIQARASEAITAS